MIATLYLWTLRNGMPFGNRCPLPIAYNGTTLHSNSSFDDHSVTWDDWMDRYRGRIGLVRAAEQGAPQKPQKQHWKNVIFGQMPRSSVVLRCRLTLEPLVLTFFALALATRPLQNSPTWTLLAARIAYHVVELPNGHGDSESLGIEMMGNTARKALWKTPRVSQNKALKATLF